MSARPTGQTAPVFRGGAVRAFLSRLCDTELPVMAALVALAVVSERFLLPAAGVALLYRALNWAGRGSPAVRTPGLWPALGLLLLLPVSLSVTAFPRATWTEVLRVLAGMGLFFAVTAWTRGRERLLIVSLGLAGLSVLLGIAAVGSVHWLSDKIRLIPVEIIRRLPRLIADVVHPNVMAGAMAVLVPFPAALALWGLPPRRFGATFLRAAGGLATLLLLGLLVLSQSRGGMAAAAGGLLLLTWLRWPRWGWLPTAAALAAGAFFTARGVDLVRLVTVQAVASGGSVSGRMEIWSRALFMLQDFPFTGVGMGTFGQVVDLFYPLGTQPVGIPHAHNLFLQIGVDLGYPGLVCWLLLLLASTAAAWKAYRSPDRAIQPAGAALLAAFAILCAHGLVDAVLWDTRPAVLVWGLFGLAAAAQKIAGASQPENSPVTDGRVG